LYQNTSRLEFDYGFGKNRKSIWLDEVDLSSDYYKALIGFHTFTGNDYVSAFFKKGKSLCWKTLLKKELKRDSKIIATIDSAQPERITTIIC
jgi:hypothetical protein